MPQYRVVAGTHRTADGERVEAGETVELTEEERAAFPNTKFERVESDDTDTEEADPTVTAAVEEDEVEDVEASGDVPDPDGNYDLLSKMAKHYEGDEVHGSMAGTELAEFFETLSDTEIAHLKDEARAELEG